LTSKGVVFVIINEADKLLFCSPRCIDEYGLQEGDEIKWLQSGEKPFITLSGTKNNKVEWDKILVTSVFDLVWHGKNARMLLLDENPKFLTQIAKKNREKIDAFQPEYSPWCSFCCKFDQTLEIVSISNQVENLIGYKAEELLSGKAPSFRELIPENERTDLWKKIQTEIKKRKEYQIIYSIRTAQGDLRWLQEQGQQADKTNSVPASLEGWIFDITARKKTAEALWESELQYRSLVDASPDSVLMLDKDGVILLVNRHFCDLIGVPSPDAILGKSVFEFFSTNFNEQEISNIQGAIAVLPETENALLLKLNTGEEIPAEANISSIKGSDGEVRAYIAVARDVRQRNKTQQALRESEARYRAIVEENPEMVVRFSQDGTVTFSNAAFCKYVGLSIDELVGQKVTRRMTGPGHHLIEKLISQFNPDMPPMENEFSIHDSKGGENWFRWRTIAIKDTNGNFIEYQSIGEVITDQKKARLAELEAQNRLREIMENIKLVAIIMDVTGKVTFCNSYFLEITGWKREEVLQSDWVSHFVPPEFVNDLRKNLFEGAQKGSVPIRNENPILTKNGDQRLIAWYNTLLRDSHGKYVGIASIGEDITEKHFSEKLRETLLTISQSANRSEDLNSLYQSIQDALKELMPVDNFFIALYDAEKDILTFPFYKDEFDPQPEPGKPRHGLTEYVLRTGKTTLVNPERFEELVASGEVESIGAPSLDWIGVPLNVENCTIGVMGAQTYSPGIRYEAKDEQILTFVSNQIAMAIERKKAEQALRNSQKRNELLIEASTDAIFTEAQDGTILDCNQQATVMYGYTREELQKMNVNDLIPDDIVREHPDYLRWEIEQGGILSDLPNKRKDGNIFPVEVSIRETTLDDMPILIAYVRDITEQKQAARVIIESEEKFRALAENSAAGIFIHSGGKNIYVNPMWTTITEYSTLDLLLKKPIDLMDPILPRREKEKLAARLKGENLPDRFEYNIVARSGEKRVIDLNLTSIKFEDKDAVMGTAIDITNRKQREHELEVIAQMSEALRINLSQVSVLDTTISKIGEILSLDGAYIALVDKPNQEILLKKSFGIWKPIEGTTLPMDQGLGGHIVSTGLPYINHQPQKDPYISRTDLVTDLASIAGVPLIMNGETIGSLVIGAKQRLTENDVRLLKAIGDFAASALHRADLFENSSRQASELKQAYNSTLEGWALALELRDKETQGHSVRIANLTLKLARRMGIPDSEMENIRRGALLHDIGKLGVPDTILLKHSSLTADEWAVMQKHPMYAFEMLSQLKDFKNSIDIPFCHHEWWDGSGYPRGLEGTAIPLAARIFCIVDVWDALTSNRPYRDAWKKNEALAHIINQAGTHFDPDVVNEFIQMIVEEK
jgi:PAS domain S-box-containing protein/putative nucleotidyltransferase with HDIG domain